MRNSPIAATIVLALASFISCRADELPKFVAAYYAPADSLTFFGEAQVREPAPLEGDESIVVEAYFYRVLSRPIEIPKEESATISKALLKHNEEAEKAVMDGPLIGATVTFILFDSQKKAVALVSQISNVFVTSPIRIVSGNDSFQALGTGSSYSYSNEFSALVGFASEPRSLQRSTYYDWRLEGQQEKSK